MRVIEIDAILTEAHAAGASDVYLFPVGRQYRLQVRYPTKITVLQAHVSLEQASVWINLLKYRAGMNLSEHRRVQQGATYHRQSKSYLRLSSAGDYQDRESLVIRIIAAVPPVLPAGEPNMRQLETLAVQRGLLTVCGPTGAGKTTLLYQLAKRLVQQRVVMTIEDPVEIDEPGFLQLQVNNAAGMTYSSLLKAALRHRPDVVIIGELRDQETGTAACEAALAGHIVLATVHTDRADEVPLRLAALGVPSKLIAGALKASAQVRLSIQDTIVPLVEIWRWQRGQGTRVTPKLAEQEESLHAQNTNEGAG